MQGAAGPLHSRTIHSSRKQRPKLPPGLQTLEKDSERASHSTRNGSAHPRTNHSHGDDQARLPRDALENRPSLEIELRRLFAILHVEEAINTGKFKERTSAWQYVHLLHESVPMGTVMCDHIDDAMTYRMSLEKKRIAAIKAIEEARATRPSNQANTRNQNHRGSRRSDKQDRHDCHDAAALTVDWPPNLVTQWHRLTRRILCINRLPVAEAKSSHPAAVVRDSLNFIGCIWNLETGFITPSPDKLERVTARAKALLEASSSKPEDWQRITGKLLWFATLNRPLLACTQAIFHRTKTEYPTTPGPNLPSSKREVRTLTALLPFASVDILLPISHIIVAFDASTTAGAVTYAYAPPQLAERLWLASQKARFTRGRDASDQLQEVTQAIQQCHWKLAFIHHRKKSEHINCLEACTAVLEAEWMARSRMTHTRVAVLTDSLVTLGALQKGRSSKLGLLLRCRRFAAIILAHDMRVTLAYVRSAINPADKFTRIPIQAQALMQNGDVKSHRAGKTPAF